MRQWHIPVAMLCDKHLRGEHVEHHMFAAQLAAGKGIDGYIKSPSGERLLWPGTLKARHDLVAAEMMARGDAHKSEFDYVETIQAPPYGDWFNQMYAVDVLNNIREVARRCPACRQRIENLGLADRLIGVPKGGDYYSPRSDGGLDVFISGKVVGSAPTRAKAIVVMERTRKQMRKDGTIWQ